MKEKYPNKKLKTEETKVEEPKVALVKEATGYACTRECEMMGVGAFKVGDKIYDPEIVKRVKDNPNFAKIQEDKKS